VTDIEERLREFMLLEAASEIEKYKAEIERLRAENSELLGLRNTDVSKLKPFSEFRTEVELRQEIERLRAACCGSRQMTMGDVIGDCELCKDLLTEIERLRTALQEIAAPTGEWQSCFHGMRARQALEGK